MIDRELFNKLETWQVQQPRRYVKIELGADGLHAKTSIFVYDGAEGDGKYIANLAEFEAMDLKAERIANLEKELAELKK